MTRLISSYNSVAASKLTYIFIFLDWRLGKYKGITETPVKRDIVGLKYSMYLNDYGRMQLFHFLDTLLFDIYYLHEIYYWYYTDLKWQVVLSVSASLASDAVAALFVARDVDVVFPFLTVMGLKVNLVYYSFTN